MTDDVPEDVTVTMRVGEGVALPGSERRECDRCDEAVIVNPATLASIEMGLYPDYIICLQCALEIDREDDHEHL